MQFVQPLKFDRRCNVPVQAVRKSIKEQSQGADNIFRGQFKSSPERCGKAQKTFWQRLWLQVISFLRQLGFVSVENKMKANWARRLESTLETRMFFACVCFETD